VQAAVQCSIAAIVASSIAAAAIQRCGGCHPAACSAVQHGSHRSIQHFAAKE